MGSAYYQRKPRRVSLPNQVTEVLFIFATDVLDELGVGRQRKLKMNAPRFSVGLGVVDGDLKIDMPKIAAAESLRQTHGFRSRMAAVVEPVIIDEARGFDHQRVVFPMADRVSHPAWIGVFG